MAIAPIIMAVAAVASVGVAVYSANEQKKASQQAAAAQVEAQQIQSRAAEQQAHYQQMAAQDERRARAVQSAQNAQSAAREQRQLIREERVRRARILQSSENTGTAGGSGSMGAVGSLSTTLGDASGSNRSSIFAGQQITGFAQSAADNVFAGQQAVVQGQIQAGGYLNSATMSQASAQKWAGYGQIANSVFNSVGGWSAIGKGYDRLFST